jgi:hypothetical protein
MESSERERASARFPSRGYVEMAPSHHDLRVYGLLAPGPVAGSTLPIRLRGANNAQPIV